ncbi:NUDIX domain-containing protein [Falsirhodobacter deserti]|uniref:NUDIX domain-containing protein n=1 Tax=Falsirhodobacter deserti TaxID=1365611 RepID=UPI000FE30BA0|nr:NUDIX hydrolase [Falsirhodobacter deserti]
MIRLAVRALILDALGRLLIVNAWPGGVSDLWTAPGGGANLHSSLPDNLAREVHEETGLTVSVDAPVLVNEFHDPDGSFHQVDIYFRCTLLKGEVSPQWRDPEGVVTERRWVTPDELAALRFKPDTLAKAAWGGAMIYDPLEPIIR